MLVCVFEIVAACLCASVDMVSSGRTLNYDFPFRASERVYMRKEMVFDAIEHPWKSPLTTVGTSFDNTLLNGIVSEESAVDCGNALINICSVYTAREESNNNDIVDSMRANEKGRIRKEAMGAGYYIIDAPGMARDVTSVVGGMDWLVMRAYQSTGTIINSTHAITAAHNVWPCVGTLRWNKEDEDKFYPCSGDVIQDWKRFEYIWDLKHVSIMNTWNPHLCATGKNSVNVSSIVYPNKNEMQKGTLLYYGDFFGTSHLNMNDIALIPIPNPKESIFHIDAMVDIFSSIHDARDEAFSLSDYEYLAIVGYPGTKNGKGGSLLDDTILENDLNAFFHVESQLPLIGITNKFNMSDGHILHDIPTLTGLSGSLLYGVTQSGQLNPVGVHIGALGFPYQKQLGISIVHPFFWCLVQG